MAYRSIPELAVLVGALVSAYLLRAFRDNVLWLNNARAAIAAQLHPTTGHGHTTGTKTASYNFDDEIRTISGVNDMLDVRFGGGPIAPSTQAITLDAGTRTPTVHAAHVQSKLRAAFSSTTAIGVSYDATVGSETRGMFRIQNTGTSDSTYARVLQILLKTGASADQSAGPSMGFSKIADLKGAYGYRGKSGFADSYVQDRVTLGDAGKLGTASFVDGAFITRTFADAVVPAGAFQADSIAGSGTGGAGQIADGALIGSKLGAAEQSNSDTILGGNTVDFTITMANGGSGRRPRVSLSCTSGAESWALQLISLTHLTGNDWDVKIKNISTGTVSGVVATGY